MAMFTQMYRALLILTRILTHAAHQELLTYGLKVMRGNGSDGARSQGLVQGKQKPHYPNNPRSAFPVVRYGPVKEVCTPQDPPSISARDHLLTVTAKYHPTFLSSRADRSHLSGLLNVLLFRTSSPSSRIEAPPESTHAVAMKGIIGVLGVVLGVYS